MINVVRRNLQLHYANSFLKCCSQSVFAAEKCILKNYATVNKTRSKGSLNTQIARQPVPKLDETFRKYLRYLCVS